MSVVKPNHEEFLAMIGRDYYLENQSKVQIAERYGISRFQVARLLDEARAEGVVRIEVRFPRLMDVEGQNDLARRLGVSKVIVVRSVPDSVQQRDLLAQAAAHEFMDSAGPGMTVGVSWSRTLDLAARHITSLPQCEVVQLAGALPGSGSSNPLELMQRLGRLARGRVWPLWSPLVVDSAQTAAALRQQPEISTALSKADRLDLAAVSIGAWAPDLSTVWDRVDERVQKQASAAGAVAEISGRLVDRRGHEVRTDLDSRILAVSLAQLKNAGKVIAVAQGQSRAAAVLAAVRAGVVSVLVIDDELAVALTKAA